MLEPLDAPLEECSLRPRCCGYSCAVAGWLASQGAWYCLRVVGAAGEVLEGDKEGKVVFRGNST